MLLEGFTTDGSIGFLGNFGAFLPARLEMTLTGTDMLPYQRVLFESDCLSGVNGSSALWGSHGRGRGARIIMRMSCLKSTGRTKGRRSCHRFTSTASSGSSLGTTVQDMEDAAASFRDRAGQLSMVDALI